MKNEIVETIVTKYLKTKKWNIEIYDGNNNNWILINEFDTEDINLVTLLNK